MFRRYLTSLLLLWSLSFYSQEKLGTKDIHFQQIVTDTLFNSPQIISIITLKKGASNPYQLQIATSTDSLNKTSSIAQSNKAWAAINGGFFNTKKGGSVSYLEKNNQVLAWSSASEIRKNEPDYFLNAAIVFKKKNRLKLEKSKKEQRYQKSKKEVAVLVTGPLLLHKKKAVPLFNSSFSADRHPRTILASTKKHFYLITIDGRSDKAYGMSLFEVQDFLLALGCSSAINLDGGGSTTMWMNNQIMNQPSDKNGERPVANAIVVIKKEL